MDLYAEITDRMIAKLEAGVVPWHKPWKLSVPGSGAFVRLGLPLRMSGGAKDPKPYRGINLWLLIMAAHEAGYVSPWWGTYDQIAELSGMEKVPNTRGKGFHWRSPDGKPRGVRKGEKSVMIVFWKRLRVPDKSEGAKPGAMVTIPMLRYYRVFNANQADGLPDRFYPQPEEEPEVTPDEPAEVETIPAAEAIWQGFIERYSPEVVNADPNRANYNLHNRINLPPREMFDSAAEFYSTAYHEATHWTGHPSRLKRPGIETFDHFGSPKYAREELCAEMGAAFLCGTAGVDGVFDNSAAYIGSWLGKLRNDKKLVVTAAQQAAKAADYIQGVEYQNGEPDNESELARAA